MGKLRVTAQIILVMLLALAAGAGPLFAQVKSSGITGTVTDQSGAVLPNVAVTVTQQETNTATTTQSDSKGEYNVPYLPIGHYTVTAAVQGFKTYKKTDINLEGNTTIRADIAMAIGAANATVEVQANALALQTESATLTAAVDSETIVNQANINANPLYYATLEPGVVADPQMLLSTNLGVGYNDRRNMSGLRINGGEIGSNDVQLDGVSIQGAAWHETAVLPNPDALAEVRTITNNFSADVGMAQGVTAQTIKQGTNKFHGDLNYMLRNEDLNANTFSNNFQLANTGNCPSYCRQHYRLQQGWGSIGGPIIIPKLLNGRNRLFFFASYLRLTHSSTNVLTATVPTALERVGNFSQTQVAANGGTYAPVNIFNPFTATGYNGSTTQFVRQQYSSGGTLNIIPPAGSGPGSLSPYGLLMLQGYPMPNVSGNGGPTVANGGGINPAHANNFTNAVISPEARNSLNARVDYKLSNSQSLFVSAGLSKGSIISPNTWGTFANGPWVNQSGTGQGGNINDLNPYGVVGDTIVINPTTVVDVRYGVTHIKSIDQDLSATGNPATYGQPSAVSAVAPFGANQLPGIPAITPYTALNSNSYVNKAEHQLNHMVSGSISKEKGKLTMKFGAEYRVYLQNWQDIQWQSPPIGVINYSGQYGGLAGTNVTSLEPQIVNQGFIPASIAAGVEGWSMNAGTAPRLALASKYTAMYAQSTWRTTTKLLLTFGLRYEVQPGPTERHNHITSWDLTQTNPFATAGSINPSGNLGLLSFPGVGGYSRNLYNTTWNNFGPRGGFTYQWDNSTVLRGGYGRNYLPSNTGYNANGTVYNPLPWDNAVNPIPFGLTNTGVPVGTFDQNSNTYVVAGPGAVQSPAVYGGTGSVTIFDRNQYKTGHTDQWNFFIERQITSSWLLDAGYVGSRGGTLPWRGFLLNGPFNVDPGKLAAWRQTWINNNGASDPAQAAVANPMPSLVFNPATKIGAAGTSGLATISAIDAAMPYTGLLGVTDYVSIGTDYYNAFETQLQHTLTHGLSFQASYVWSKATGNVGNSATQTFAESQQSGQGPSGGVDYHNIKNNHSILDFDVSNRFVLTGSYALPFGAGKLLDANNKVVNMFIGGWETTGALNLQTGEPFAPICAAQNTTTLSGTINGRCVQVAGQPLKLPKQNQHFFSSGTLTLPDGHVITPTSNTKPIWNPDAFTTQMVTFANGTSAQDQYQAGTTPLAYGSMRTAGFENLNLSVIKKFTIREGTDFELHVNATNALNHTNLSVPNNTFTPLTAVTPAQAAQGAAIGENSNAQFGAYPLPTAEPRQLTIQGTVTF